MFSMFNRVTYKKSGDYYKFSIYLGSNVKGVIAKNTSYTIKKLDAMFEKLSMMELTIHEFFILDLHYILEQLLENSPAYGIDLVAVNNLNEVIKQEILSLPAEKKEVGRLDLSRLNKVFKFTPLKNQLPAYEAYPKIRHIPGNKGMLLDGGVGVGKTYISLSIAELVNSDIVMIVAPKPTVTKVWEHSISMKTSYLKNLDQLMY